MKDNLKKISDMLKTIFGYGIMITLFVGGFTFFGYIAALIIGGDTAVLICDFLYNKVIVVVIYASTIMIVLGTIAMYLAGETALTPTKRDKEDKKKLIIKEDE